MCPSSVTTVVFCHPFLYVIEYYQLFYIFLVIKSINLSSRGLGCVYLYVCNYIPDKSASAHCTTAIIITLSRGGFESLLNTYLFCTILALTVTTALALVTRKRECHSKVSYNNLLCILYTHIHTDYCRYQIIYTQKLYICHVHSI